MLGYLAGDEKLNEVLESPGTVCVCSSDNCPDTLHAGLMTANVEYAVDVRAQAAFINDKGEMEAAISDAGKPHTAFNVASAGVASPPGIAPAPGLAPSPDMTAAYRAPSHS